MKIFVFAIISVLSTVALARGVAVDFRADKTGAGWDLGETAYDGNRGRKFPTDEAVLTSPLFDGNITSATVVVSFTQSVSNAPAINVWAGTDADSATLRGSITNRTANDSTTNLFAFTSADAVHALKFTSSRNGNTRVNPFVVSVEVRWTGGALPAPTGLSATPTSSNAFHATWDAAEDAEGYEVRVWREEPRAASGDYVWNETFEGLAEDPENSTDFSGKMDTLSFDVPGWTGVNIRHPTGCGGAIQIGTASSTGSGALLSPAIYAASGLSLAVEGLFPDRATGTMPVYLVAGATTNLLADIAFNKSLKREMIALPALSEESQLLFCSPTNGADRRVRLESVAVASDYVAAGVAEVDVPGWEAHGTAEPHAEVTGLATGVYHCAVRMVSGTERSAWSQPCSVSLEDLSARMIPLTGRECVYADDMDWLGATNSMHASGMLARGVLAAKSKNQWNGECKAEAHGHNYTQGGFYSVEMDHAGNRAFVMRATGEDDHALTVTIVNKGETAIESFDISYLGVQVFDGATNNPPRRLEAAWCSTVGTCPEPFASEGWTAVPELDFAELSSVKAGPVFLTREVQGSIALGQGLEPDQVFSFRLRFAKGSNASALGIDNLRIEAFFVPKAKRPTRIVVR